MRLPGGKRKDGARRFARALKPNRRARGSAAPEPERVQRAGPRLRLRRPARGGPRRPVRALARAAATAERDLPATLMARLARHDRRRLTRRLVIALVVVEGAGAAAALAMLPSVSLRELATGGAATAQWRFAEGEIAAPAGPAPHRPGPSYYRKTTRKHVSPAAEVGFLPVYREAARAFGVSWRLLASVHRQETAFSTVASTYHGLNAFGCCAGPMQFNVTNGPPSTWALYRDSFRKGHRPKRYPHPTAHHPSIYDDFDSIMAAAALLRDAGAGGGGLDSGAWSAAYSYYGHDTFGTEYASQVVGRAQTWERDGFCLNCIEDAALVAALDDAYGVEARRVLREAEKERKHKKKHKKHGKTAADRQAKRAREEAVAARRQARRDAARLDAGRSAPPSPAAPMPAPAAPAPTPTTTAPAPPTEAPPPAAPPPPPCTGLHKVLGCG
jgi:hypothetical protein